MREQELLTGLRRGEDAAFESLLQMHHRAMLKTARAHVGNAAYAHDVVQDALLAVFLSVDRFEGRASLKTWLLSIVKNQAITQSARERRWLPLSSWDGEDEARLEAVLTRNGHRRPTLHRRSILPEDELMAKELRAEVCEAIASLSARQQVVLVLRDLEGWTATEVCDLLHICQGNQRVLLHRARAKMRLLLERDRGCAARAPSGLLATRGGAAHQSRHGHGED